jgi:hypothetical protein
MTRNLVIASYPKMPISKGTQLAQAKRQLLRLEQDEATLRLRIAGLSPAEQKMAAELYRHTVEKQRDCVARLERELDSHR